MTMDFGRMLAGVCLAAFLAPAAAQAGDRVGSLNCRLMGNGISVVVENQQIDCAFQDDDEGAAPAHYVGTLTKVGPNITVNGQGEMGWGVVAATKHPGPGALAGDYVGAGVSAKVVVGGGAGVLVGGSDDTISLQPFNIQAGTGLGWNAGIEKLTLAYVSDQPAPQFAHPHHHHKHHHHHHHH